MAPLLNRPLFAAAFVSIFLSCPFHLDASEPARLPTAHTFDTLAASLDPLRPPEDDTENTKIFENAEMLLEKGRLFIAAGNFRAAGRIAEHLEATLSLLEKRRDIKQKERDLTALRDRKKSMEAEATRLRKVLHQLKSERHSGDTSAGAAP